MAALMPGKPSSPDSGPALLPLGHHQGKPPIRLSRPVYVVGSRASARIHLVSSSVSKAHALIIRSNGRTYIRDLASRNKVFINGDEVREAELAHDDLIKIGTFTFQYQAGPGEGQPNAEARQAMPAKLEIMGAEYPVVIDQRVILIGRRSSCDVNLLEESVSTSHAVIFEVDGQRFVRDLGSRSGTFVNGVNTHQHQLNVHDVIRIGDTELKYVPNEVGAATVVEEEPPADVVIPEPVELPQIPEPSEPMVEAPLEITAEDIVEPVEAAAIPMAPEPPPESPAVEEVVEEPAVAPVAEEPELDMAPLAIAEEPPAVEEIAAPVEPETPHATPETIAADESLEIDLSPLPVIEEEASAAVEPAEQPEEPLAVETSEPVVEAVEPEEAPVEELAVEESVIEEVPTVVETPEPVVEAVEPGNIPAEELAVEEPAIEETPAVAEVPAVGQPVDMEAPLVTEELELAPEPVAEEESAALEISPVAEEPIAAEPPIAAMDDTVGQETIEAESSIAEPILDLAPPEEIPDLADSLQAEPVAFDSTPVIDEEPLLEDISSILPLETPRQRPVRQPPLPAAIELPTPAAEEPLPVVDEPAEVAEAPQVTEIAEVPEVPEVMDKTEPTPQSALQSAAEQLAMDVLSDSAVVPSPEAQMSDTTFDRAVREFTGDEIGEIVEPPPAKSEPSALEAAVRAGEVTPEEPPLEELAAEESAIEEPPVEEPVAEKPPLIEEVPKAPPPIQVKAPAAPTPPQAPGSRPRVPWGANQDNFLGGVPISLKQPPSPPPAPAAATPFADDAVKELIDQIDDTAATAEAAAAGAPPSASSDNIPPLILPPRPKRGEFSQRRRNRDVEPEPEPVAELQPHQVSTGFDGLAMSPLREMDVFSHISPPAASEEGAQAETGEEADPTESQTESVTPASMRKNRVVPSLPGVAEGQPAPEPVAPVAYVAEISEGESAAVRHKYVRRVAALVGLMIVLIGASSAAIYRFLGATTTVEGSITYKNLAALTMLERKDFQVKMLRILGDDATRRAARVKLHDHPEPEEGFLADQMQYVKVVDHAAFSDARPDVLTIHVSGRDADGDSMRVAAMLAAQYELNHHLSDEASRARQGLIDLKDSLKRYQEDVGRLSGEIEATKLADETRPSRQQLTQLEAEVSQLEQKWNDSVAAVKSAEAELNRLKVQPVATDAGAKATTAPADDEKLKALQASLDEMQAKVSAAKAVGSQQAASAKRSLDAALDAFQKQVADAQSAMNGNPELTAYVQAAQKLQETTRQLTDDLIHRQESQFTRLTELKTRLNERMEQRRVEAWQGDKPLQELTEREAILSRQYNAAVGGGLAKEADDKKVELDLVKNMIKARQDLLPGDTFYADAIQQIQTIIDSTQKDIAEDRRRTEQLLTTLQSSFVSGQTIEKLPQEQKELAAQMKQRLDQINAARKQYNQAADESASDGDSQLKSQIATVQAAIEARNKQLTEQSLKGAKDQQEQALASTIHARQKDLDNAREAEGTASAAYFAKHKELREAQSRMAASSDNAKKLDELIRQKDVAERSLQANNLQLENKQRAAETAVEPIQPSDRDIIRTAGDDRRLVYTLSSGGGILVVFSMLIFWTLHHAGTHAPIPSIQATDLRPVSIPDDASAGPPTANKGNNGEDEDHEPAVI